jgi:hypothetical protein
VGSSLSNKNIEKEELERSSLLLPAPVSHTIKTKTKNILNTQKTLAGEHKEY